MQKNYANIRAAGAELIAISSDDEGDTKKTVQGSGLEFPVLSDKDRAVISAYNVLDPGNNRIARPASYVLRKDGTVAWKSIDGVAVRVPTAQILTELGKL
ncbi:peroxiredoxin family protein [Candidatus Poribacteria bacterium]|nr:peroxiredoxin family protein [Candidatus Poribacteria bacterium]MYA56322.1 peroxiredoxin family protein [Candidatus Poribacteria bacterium]